jgi:hypothetical protein
MAQSRGYLGTKKVDRVGRAPTTLRFGTANEFCYNGMPIRFQKPIESMAAKPLDCNIPNRSTGRAENKCFRQGDAYFVQVRPRPRCPLGAADGIVSAIAIYQQPPLSVTQSRWHFFAGA